LLGIDTYSHVSLISSAGISSDGILAYDDSINQIMSSYASGSAIGEEVVV